MQALNVTVSNPDEEFVEWLDSFDLPQEVLIAAVREYTEERELGATEEERSDEIFDTFLKSRKRRHSMVDALPAAAISVLCFFRESTFRPDQPGTSIEQV